MGGKTELIGAPRSQERLIAADVDHSLLLVELLEGFYSVFLYYRQGP